jgi:hypothetical protein
VDPDKGCPPGFELSLSRMRCFPSKPASSPRSRTLERMGESGLHKLSGRLVQSVEVMERIKNKRRACPASISIGSAASSFTPRSP